MSPPVPSSETLDQIQRLMREAGVYEEDLDERFILGSGAGGQKVNKTSSAVQLLHLPSRTVVREQSTRSRETNRWLARRKLAETLLEKIQGEESKRKKEEAKIRHQKKRRSRRQKAKILADKRHNAAVKSNRAAVRAEE
jgi:protein subunit release factor B